VTLRVLCLCDVYTHRCRRREAARRAQAAVRRQGVSLRANLRQELLLMGPFCFHLQLQVLHYKASLPFLSSPLVCLLNKIIPGPSSIIYFIHPDVFYTNISPLTSFLPLHVLCLSDRLSSYCQS
jgi:hypothetical protein